MSYDVAAGGDQRRRYCIISGSVALAMILGNRVLFLEGEFHDMVDFVGRDIANVEHYAALGDGVLSPCGCCPSVPVSLLTRGTPLKKTIFSFLLLMIGWHPYIHTSTRTVHLFDCKII